MNRTSGTLTLQLGMTSILLIFIFTVSSHGEDQFSYGSTEGKSDACLTCHGNPQKIDGKFLINQEKYAHTTHARIGCMACHDGISDNHPDKSISPKTHCGECHPDIRTEYMQSLHAAKSACSGCHNPHKVESTYEVSGEEINRTCAGCHDTYRTMASHAEWLPQADLHLNMLPCITCHTNSKNYAITMYLVNSKGHSRHGKSNQATHEELSKIAPNGNIMALIDGNGDNYISIAELRIFNSDPSHTNLRLHGMMMPEIVTHNFSVLENRRNCTFCHVSGPGAMQTSFIALPEKNGTFTQVAVEKGAVMDALYGTPDFYMTGATRNSTLNKIGMAIIAGGLVLPIGHGSLRFLTRRNRNGKEDRS